MKKFFMVLFALVIVFLPTYSFAETELNKFTVRDFKIERIWYNKIFGSFEIENNDMKHYENLNYMLYLIPQKIYAVDGGTDVVAHSSKVMSFFLTANEKKIVAFEYEVPNSRIMLDNYALVLRLTNETSELGGLYFVGYVRAGNKDLEGYIVPSNNDNTHYYKVKDFETPMSGPYIDPGSSLTAYIDVNSNFNKNIKVRPKFTIYKRIPAFNKGKSSVQYGEEILIKANESKKIAIKLPEIEIPESYFVKVQFVDENNIPISYEYNFRYVINGKTAKISEISTLYDSHNNVLKVFLNYIGSSDSQTIDNVELNTGVYETDSGKILEEYVSNITLRPNSYMNVYSLKLPTEGTKVSVFASIKNAEDILAFKTINLSSEATSSSIEKFSDIKDTSYEKTVEMLNSYGIISGYPDGTYKPEKTLTRAELTTIALNMKKIDLTDYKVENNAFTDLNEGHWAYKAINYAYENGIVNGYGNGLFKPDNKVSYSEAITILLNTIGYKEKVESNKEAWPSNYIFTARELKIDEDTDITNFSDFANRGEISILTLNSFIIRKD